MDCVLIFIVGLFIIINLNLTNAYQDYTVRKLCPKSELSMSFNQIYNNKPGIALFNQSDSATFVHDIWSEENIDQFQNCVFTVDSNLYTQNGQYGRGIFASVNRLNFRQDSKGNCIDYIRFRFVGAHTEKICGRFTAEDEIGQRTFFNEASGIIKVHIFVNKSIPFTPLQRFVDVNLLLTAYERCIPGQSMIRCDPKNDDFCISSEFKNDNIQNCPPPYAGDETNKQHKPNQISQPVIHNNRDGSGSTTGGVTKNNIAFGLLFIPAYIAFLLSYIL